MMERTIFLMSSGVGGLTLLSLLLPRLLANPDQGLAGAATAAVSFLLPFGLALALAFTTAVFTWRARETLSTTGQVAGFLPLPLLLGGLVLLWLVVQARGG